MDDLMQHANDTGWNKGQEDSIHIQVNGTDKNGITHHGYFSIDQISTRSPLGQH